MKQIPQTLAAALFFVLPVIYLAKVYPGLPPSIPTHFGFSGKADAYGDKSTLLWLTIGLTLLSIGTYCVVLFLPKIDPKVRARAVPGNYKKIALAVAGFLAALLLVIIYATKAGNFSFNHLMGPLLGVLFAVLGNFMYNIKPNYFVGVRVPWTLESDDNWRATHRLTGKLWFIGGIVIAVGCLLLPEDVGKVVGLAGILVLAFVPIAYSFFYFRSHPQKTT